MAGALFACGRVTLLVSDQLDNLVSTREAADSLGVSASTIRGWASRGYVANGQRVKLKPADLDVSGRPLYKLIDVMRASAAARNNAIGSRRIA